MKTIRRKLDEIGGVDLEKVDQSVLRGGVAPAYPYCFCMDEYGVTMVSGLCGLPSAAECKIAAENMYPDLDCVCIDFGSPE